jgi:hypothetical protein
MHKTHLIVSSIFLLLTACENSKDDSFQKLNEKVTELENRLAISEHQLFDLKNSVSDLSTKLNASDNKDRVFLIVGNNDSIPLATSIGKLTLSIKDVQPFANGSKVFLNFGNPLNTDVKDIKFNIHYGMLDKYGLPDASSEKSKEVKIIEPLKSGSWNIVDVVLENLPVTNLGYISIDSFEISTISLRSYNNK